MADAATRVVIIGGGFGGLYATRALKRAPADVTLIDRRNFHLFQPLLYQVATGGLSPGEIGSPLRAIVTRHKNTRVLMGDVVEIDVGRRIVQNMCWQVTAELVRDMHHYFCRAKHEIT